MKTFAEMSDAELLVEIDKWRTNLAEAAGPSSADCAATFLAQAEGEWTRRMPRRSRPPDRRDGVRRKQVVNGVTSHATVNFYDGGVELFLDGPHAGSPFDLEVKDAGIVISLALQHGCPPEVLAAALSAHPSPSPAIPGETAEERIDREAGSHVAAAARWLLLLVKEAAPPGEGGPAPTLP